MREVRALRVSAPLRFRLNPGHFVILALVKRKDDEVAGVESEIAGVQENRSALTSR